jgi:hypothetical protein
MQILIAQAWGRTRLRLGIEPTGLSCDPDPTVHSLWVDAQDRGNGCPSLAIRNSLHCTFAATFQFVSTSYRSAHNPLDELNK